jgi:PAS domain S-box-containing protein
MGKWFDHIPELVLIADQSHMLRINKRWEIELGYDLETILNYQWISYLHPHDVADTLEVLSNVKSEYSGLYNRYRKENGDYVWISWCGKKYYSKFFSSGRVIRLDNIINPFLNELAVKRKEKFDNIMLHEDAEI